MDNGQPQETNMDKTFLSVGATHVCRDCGEDKPDDQFQTSNGREVREHGEESRRRSTECRKCRDTRKNSPGRLMSWDRPGRVLDDNGEWVLP